MWTHVSSLSCKLHILLGISQYTNKYCTNVLCGHMQWYKAVPQVLQNIAIFLSLNLMMQVLDNSIRRQNTDIKNCNYQTSVSPDFSHSNANYIHIPQFGVRVFMECACGNDAKENDGARVHHKDIMTITKAMLSGVTLCHTATETDAV